MANFIPKIEYTELGTGTPKSVNFSDPPEGDPFSEQRRHVKRATRSLSGQQQTTFNYTLKRYQLEFLFQSETIKDEFVDFLDNHAAKGGKFNYFIHNDEAGFEEFELVGNRFPIRRPIPDGAGDFEYNLEFTIERVE